MDALLRQLGVDPETLPIPQKTERRLKRNELRRAIMSTLPKAAYKLTYIALSAMKKAGPVHVDQGLIAHLNLVSRGDGVQLFAEVARNRNRGDRALYATASCSIRDRRSSASSSGLPEKCAQACTPW